VVSRPNSRNQGLVVAHPYLENVDNRNSLRFENRMNSLPTAPQIPTCSQPGGGWGMSVEMAWARVRRTLLRAFRPGYVRRMRELRLGTCDRHDRAVIDARDLKYIRPGCEFSFPPGTQPHPCQPFLGFARFGLCELLVITLLYLCCAGGLITAALLVHWAFWIALVVLTVVYLEVPYFFRDPERVSPTEPNILVSPADGVITHVEEVDEIEFPGKTLRISMFLSIFNVHVNRMPATVKVKQIRYFPGAFLDARDSNSAIRNEQLWIDTEDAATGTPVRAKQISGKVARRIVCWIKAGDEIQRGERFGMIKLGSRADILVPVDKIQEVCVKVGDVVRAGTSLLLRLGTPQ